MQVPPFSGVKPAIKGRKKMEDDDTDCPYSRRSERFAEIVRELRHRAGDTLQALADRSGLSPSTISKIENSQLSPSYETILRLADGLEVDLTALFEASGGTPMAAGRRSVTRRGQGMFHISPQYAYEMLCPDLSRKQFIPLHTKVTARSLKDFPHMSQHEGEEFVYILKGTVELHTEHYEPITLEPGDSCYFDSAMGHACISVSKEEAEMLWITSRNTPVPASKKPVRKARKTRRHISST